MAITGFPVIVFYTLAIGVLTYLYTERYLGVGDEGHYEEQEILMEGFGNSSGLFLLSWIICYSYQ